MAHTTVRSNDPPPAAEILDLFGGETTPGVTAAPHAAHDARAALKPRPTPRSVAGSAAAPVVGGDRTIQIPLANIVAAPWQPRRGEDRAALAQLIASIREVGLLQPIVARPISEPGATPPRYQLVAGHRRVAAVREITATEADPTISALVVNVDDVAARRITLAENEFRVPLSAYERAITFETVIVAIEAAAGHGLTVDEVHELTGWSRGAVSQYRRVAQRITPDALLEAGFVAPDGGVAWAAVNALTLAELLAAAKEGTASEGITLLQTRHTGTKPARGGRRQRESAADEMTPAADAGAAARREALATRGGFTLRLSRPLLRYSPAEARGYATDLVVALGLLATAASDGAPACTLDTGDGRVIVLTRSPELMTPAEREAALRELTGVADLVRGLVEERAARD